MFVTLRLSVGGREVAKLRKQAKGSTRGYAIILMLTEAAHCIKSGDQIAHSPPGGIRNFHSNGVTSEQDLQVDADVGAELANERRIDTRHINDKR